MLPASAGTNGTTVPHTGGGALSSLDMKTVGERTAMLAADRQARHGLTPPWACGKNAKEFRAALGPKPVAGLLSLVIGRGPLAQSFLNERHRPNWI